MKIRSIFNILALVLASGIPAFAYELDTEDYFTNG